MGYRSQVGFVIAKKEGQIIPDFTTIDPDFTFDVVKDTDDAIFYLTEDVKWYDNNADYPLVAKVSEYFDEMDAESRDSDYMFIRLGEDSEDMETRGNYWDNPFDFGYTRKLVFDEESVLGY